MLMYSTATKFNACFEHSNFFKVKDPDPRESNPTLTEEGTSTLFLSRKIEKRLVAEATQLNQQVLLAGCPRVASSLRVNERRWGTGRRGRTNRYSSSFRRTVLISPRDPTTSFLTATALIYAIGAGITAAAGLIL